MNLLERFLTNRERENDLLREDIAIVRRVFTARASDAKSDRTRTRYSLTKADHVLTEHENRREHEVW